VHRFDGRSSPRYPQKVCPFIRTGQTTGQTSSPTSEPVGTCATRFASSAPIDRCLVLLSGRKRSVLLSRHDSDSWTDLSARTMSPILQYNVLNVLRVEPIAKIFPFFAWRTMHGSWTDNLSDLTKRSVPLSGNGLRHRGKTTGQIDCGSIRRVSRKGLSDNCHYRARACDASF